jgi:hypothetical protein
MGKITQTKPFQNGVQKVANGIGSNVNITFKTFVKQRG